MFINLFLEFISREIQVRKIYQYLFQYWCLNTHFIPSHNDLISLNRCTMYRGKNFDEYIFYAYT